MRLAAGRSAPGADERNHAMSKEQQQQLDTILRSGQIDADADVPTLRAAFAGFTAQVPVPPDVEQVPAALGEVESIEVRTPGATADRVILYFHSGVYVIGSAASSVPLVSDLVRRTAVRAITVDYRLAPENPYPAAVDDAQAAYEGLLAEGLDPGQIALAGESAGAGLAVALLLRLRNRGATLPACAVLFSPYVDLTLSGDTMSSKKAVDPLLSPESLRLRVSDYAADADPADPFISPVFGDLTGLPPLLIQVGSQEVLLSDAVRLAARAASDDVEVTLEVTPGVPHVFQTFVALLDEAGVALDHASAFVTTHFPAS
jgi:monoterpene epsilon-lactone hydrolase